MKISFRIICAIVGLIFCACGGPQAKSDSELVVIAVRIGYSGTNVTQTVWSTMRTKLEKQPLWDGISSPIPLAAEKACSLALMDVKAHFPNVSGWMVSTIEMRNLLAGGESGNMYSYPDVWSYEIVFVPRDKLTRDKFEKDIGDQPLTRVVLFDGTLVSSKVKPAENEGVLINR